MYEMYIVSLSMYLNCSKGRVNITHNREFANNVFDARIYFPLRYTSLISVCDVIS